MQEFKNICRKSLRGIFLLVLLIIVNYGFGFEDDLPDSIKSISSDSASIIEQAKYYQKNAIRYNKQGRYRPALYSAKKALEYFGKHQRRAKDTALDKAYYYMGYSHREVAINYYYLGEYVDAVWHYNKGIEALHKMQTSDSVLLKKQRGILARCFNGKAVIFSYQGDYVKATQSFLDAVAIYEKDNNQKGIAKVYNNIGVLQKDQKNYKKSFEYYAKALEIYETLNDESHIGSLYGNIGSLYYEQGDYNKALAMFKRARTIQIKDGNKRDIARSYNNFAEVYFAKKQYNKALSSYLESVKIKKEEEDVEGLTSAYIGIANTYIELQKLDQAEQYAYKAQKLSEQLASIKSMAKINEVLYRIYKKRGNFKDALHYHEKYKTLSDSTNNQEHIEMANKLQVKYDISRKEQEIELLSKRNKSQTEELVRQNQENKRQRIILIFIFAFGVIVILVAVFIYSRYRLINRQKSIIQTQQVSLKEKTSHLQEALEEIHQQKEELIVQRDTISNQKEKAFNLFSDLKSSIDYATHIQQALFPSHHLLENIFTDHYVFHRPHSIVSGDFYWAKQVKEWNIVAVADCTGHGVPGALMSMLGITFLNEIVKYEEVRSTSAVLEILRDYIIAALQNKEEGKYKRDGLDISIFAFNKITHELLFSGANSNMYLIRRKGHPLVVSGKVEDAFTDFGAYDLYMLKGDRMPIGFEEDMQPFKQLEVSIQEGDQLFMFTDGFTDQFGGPEDKKIKNKRFQQLILENVGKSSFEQDAILKRYFEEWKGENRQIDDVLVLSGKLRFNDESINENRLR